MKEYVKKKQTILKIRKLINFEKMATGGLINRIFRLSAFQVINFENFQKTQ